MIEAVVASPSFDKSGKLVNEKGETPLHIAVKPHLKSTVSSTVLSCLVNSNVIDPSTKDKNGKKACDYVKDDRVKLLQDAMARFIPEKKGSKKKKRKKSDKSKDISGKEAQKDPAAELALKPSSENAVVITKSSPKLLSPSKDVSYVYMTSQQKMVFQLNRLRKKEPVYFLESDAEEDEESNQLKPVILSPRGAHMVKLSPRRALVSAKTSPNSKHSPSIPAVASEPLPVSNSAWRV